MSTEEDPELRDLIAKCLETNGVLGKIRAQLRATTFLALDKQEDNKVNFPINNAAVQNYVSTKDGMLAVSLVREFLSFFNMQFTLAVFDPESCENVSYTPLSRSLLASSLGLSVSDTNEPLLQSLIKQLKTPSGEKGDTILTENREILRSEVTNGDDYDEDFQSASTSSTPRNNPPKDGNLISINNGSVEEDLADVSGSDILTSQVSNIDDTLDKSTNNSSLGADFAEKL